jgi:hypothetical protein
MRNHIINIQLEVELLFENRDEVEIILNDTGFTVQCYDLSFDGRGVADWYVPVDITASSTVDSIVNEIEDLIASAPGVIAEIKEMQQ